MQSEAVSKAVLAELNYRLKKIELLRSMCFKEQLDFIDDPAKLKTAQCTRRAGKSYGAAGINLSLTSVAYPRSTCLYIATTRMQAQRILLKDIMYDLNRKCDLGLTFNLTQLIVKFPNESLIYLMGLDSKPEEMEKALGQKYRLVVIDEAGSWKQDQRHMIHSVIEPACADLEGTICMIGSPQNSLKSYFYDITGRDMSDPEHVSGWSRHKWGWWNNPHTARQVKAQIERIKNVNPSVVETPSFKQMYQNQWVVDPGARVYKYDEERNSADCLPADNRYVHTLGLDLGFNDDTAITIGAYSEHDPNFYFVDAFKQKGLDITAVAGILERFKVKYRPVKWVVDGASKQAVQELVKRHGFPLIPADKKGKEDMIEIMNADFIMGRIKLLPAAQPLADEYLNLIWDDKSGRRREHPACPNHCADSGMYNWRMSYHYASTAEDRPPVPGSAEAMEAWWDNEASRASKQSKEDFAVRDFGKEYGYKQNGISRY